MAASDIQRLKNARKRYAKKPILGNAGHLAALCQLNLNRIQVAMWRLKPGNRVQYSRCLRLIDDIRRTDLAGYDLEELARQYGCRSWRYGQAADELRAYWDANPFGRLPHLDEITEIWRREAKGEN